MHYLNALPKVTFCPTIANGFLQENSGVFRSSIVDLTSNPLVKQYIDTGNAKPITQTAYQTTHHHHKEIEKQVKEMLQNCIIKPSFSLWASPVMLVR